MWIWLLGVVIFVLIWGKLWRALPAAAFGVLIGLPVAWIASLLLNPYVTGMKNIPLWLPPLPLVIVALTLFVFGVIVWFRADKLGPPRRTESHEHEHGHH
jgi:hypothetical protein